MFTTSRNAFSLRARLVIPVTVALAASLGALHCSEDDAAPTPTASAGSSGAGSQGIAGTGGTGGTTGGGSAGAAGQAGSAGVSAAAGASGGAGAAGAATAEPIEITQGCVGQYTDLSSKGDGDRKIEAFGVSWTPSCVEIAAGQSVQWAVDYTTHPLRKGVRGDSNAGSPGNPIPDTDGGDPVTVKFPTPGFYPFFCNYHATPDGKGMVGLVHVK